MKKSITILLAALLALSMAACADVGKPASSQAPASSEPQSSQEIGASSTADAKSSAPVAVTTGADTAEDAVKLAFDAFKKQDRSTFSSYVVDAKASNLDQAEQMAGNDPDLEKILVQDFSYETQGVKEDGDSAIVTTKITNVDLSNLFHDVITWSMQLSKDQPNITAEDADQLTGKKTVELLKAAAGKTASATCEITVNKDEGGWRMVLDEKTSDALYGGMISGMSSTLESIMGELGGQ